MCLPFVMGMALALGLVGGDDAGEGEADSEREMSCSASSRTLVCASWSRRFSRVVCVLDFLRAVLAREYVCSRDRRRARVGKSLEGGLVRVDIVIVVVWCGCVV